MFLVIVVLKKMVVLKVSSSKVSVRLLLMSVKYLGLMLSKSFLPTLTHFHFPRLDLIVILSIKSLHTSFINKDL